MNSDLQNRRIIMADGLTRYSSCSDGNFVRWLIKLQEMYINNDRNSVDNQHKKGYIIWNEMMGVCCSDFFVEFAKNAF